MIPKHSTCPWMAINDGLKTRDLLSNKFQVPNRTYIFCRSNCESMHPAPSHGLPALQPHLVLNPIKLKAPNSSLVDQMQLLLSFCHKSRKENLTIAKLCYPSFMWHIWRERNSRISTTKRTPPMAAHFTEYFGLGSEKNYLPLFTCQLIMK